MSSCLPYVIGRLNELAESASPHAALDREGITFRDPSVLVRALSLTGDLFDDHTPPPSVVPTIDGGVQFVWHKGGWDIEIEVLPQETEVWGRNRNTESQFSGRLSETKTELEQALTEISNAQRRRAHPADTTHA